MPLPGSPPSAAAPSGNCPAVQWEMALGVQEAVGNNAGTARHGDTVRAGIHVALGQNTTCKERRTVGISNTRPWLRKPSSQQLRVASDLAPAESGQRLTLRGPGPGPVAASPMGCVSDCSPLLGACQGPPGHAGTLRRACPHAGTRSSCAQDVDRKAVLNCSVPALLRPSTWAAP